MIKRWNALTNMFNAFEMRERVLLSGALTLVVFFIWDFAFLMPIQKTIDTAQLLQNASTKSMQSVDAELKVFEMATKKDPDADLKRELEQLQVQLNGLDQELEAMAVGLIKAPDLPLMLQQLLTQSESLKLVSLTTLPIESVDLGLIKDEPEKNAPNKPAALPSAPPSHLAQLYKHGVELKLEGSYSATYKFIKALESSQWNFYWEGLAYQVNQYPNASVTLKVFTLASDRGIFDRDPGAL